MSFRSFPPDAPREVSARALLDSNEQREHPKRQPALSVSFEFFPPRTAAAEATLWATLSCLEVLRPSFVSMTYGADGTSRDRTVEIVARIQRLTQLNVVPHVTGVALTRAQLLELGSRYWAQGIRHLVAVRGDVPSATNHAAAEYASAIELVEDLKKIADFEISVAAYPEVHPEARSAQADILHLKRKVAAGATRAITQFFYDNDVYFRFRDACARAGITVPIVPGILPLSDLTQVARFAARCGATIPSALRARFDGLGRDAESSRLLAATICVEQIQALCRAGVEQVHFYTLNRAEVIYPVCLALGLRVVPGRALA